MVKENDEIISDDVEVANTLNKFFSNIVKNLKIPERFVNNSLPHSLSSHPTLKAILKYKDHSSIPVIKRFSQRISSFYFLTVDKNTVLKEIKKLNSNKAVQDTDIPVNILKENAEFFGEYIYLQFNEAIESPKFPDLFKFANITPAFKQGSRNQKDNYRPISILPLISKIFEKLICSQISNHFDNILSKFQCDFRRGYGPQHCLLLMIDKWKKVVDNNKIFGAVLTDLSEAFDCICHDLLIAKLNAYGLSLPALKLIKDYLQNRKQRTKIGSSYSDWEDITSGVPQGSILGPLLFNIFLCDLFLEDENNYFANYADDTTPYYFGSTTTEVLDNLSCLTKKLFSWFANNQMKANDDKCHLILSSPEDDIAFQIKNSTLKCSKVKKLLRVHIDYKLKLDTHVKTICKKAHRKLNALSRITNSMELPKRRILMNAFFKAQFNYFPVIWMNHSRGLNNKINRLHERCLRIIYNDKRSNFEELLNKDNSVSIHHHNIQALAIELYKVVNDMSPEVISEVFQVRDTPYYNLRNNSQFLTYPIHGVYNGTESASFLGPKIWEQILAEIRNKESLDSFKREIKKWKPVDCPCRICKTSVSNLGFI